MHTDSNRLIWSTEFKKLFLLCDLCLWLRLRECRLRLLREEACRFEKNLIR
jgi:hypothetical protein